MDDFDLDLVDELCSSFSTSRSRQNMNENVNESSIKSNRKRLSLTNHLNSSTMKKVRLSDVSNRSMIDEINTIDESIVQILVRLTK